MKKEKTEKKPVVLLLGKLPPPYMGPAIATEIILNSRLKNEFHLIHLDTRLNKELSGLGTWGWGKVFRQINILAKLKWKIVRYRPQLVWIPISQATGGFIKDSMYIIVSRLLRRKVLIHLRGSDFKNWLKRSSRTVNWYVKRVLKSCAGVIVLGNCLRYLFANFFPEEKIFVVPNGADFNMPQRKYKGEKVQLLYLSNFLKTKGIEDVIQAVQILKNGGNDNFELNAVGAWTDNNLKEELEKMVRKKNLPIKFYPPADKNKKLQYMVDSDIFIFCPRMPEGHPWVIVEAMAASLPIIATDQGAIKESVNNGENGFVVNSYSSEEMAEKINLIIIDSKLRYMMGKHSFEVYENKFSEDKLVKNLKSVFLKLF